jgi:hypothetical protein
MTNVRLNEIDSPRRAVDYHAVVFVVSIVVASVLLFQFQPGVGLQSTATGPPISSSSTSSNSGSSTIDTSATSSRIATADLSLVRPGLVVEDPLTTGDMTPWIFYGSAPVYGGATTEFENTSGLYLGVRSSTGGKYEGLYARLSADAQVFNAVLSLPANSTEPGIEFDTGMYVQTGGQGVDYVACAAGVSSLGYFWVVEQATGLVHATTVHEYWYESNRGQPLTRDCTIVTNGHNLFEAYLGGKLVYSNDSLSLGYQYPLSARLEVQSTDNGTMRYSHYSDFYATTSPSVTFGNLPQGAEVALLAGSGQLYSSAAVNSSGVASLNIAQFAMPLKASVLIIVDGQVVAGSSGPMTLWGGDEYVYSTVP